MRVLDEKNRAKVFDDRVYRDVAGMIARHIDDAGLTSGPWVDELALLKADRARVPFRDGVPPELSSAFAPYRDTLTRVACPAAAELDVTITVPRTAIGYDHR